MPVSLPHDFGFWRSPPSKSKASPYRLDLDLSAAGMETTAALIATHAVDAQEVHVVDQCPIALIDYTQLQIIQAQLAALSRSLTQTQKLLGQVTALEHLIDGSLSQSFGEAFAGLFDGSQQDAIVEFFYPAQPGSDPGLIISRGLTLLRGRAIAKGDERQAGTIDAIVVSVNRLSTQLTPPQA
jgi:hypothetical protein